MLKPIGNRVLIKPINEEKKLVGGIVQPQSSDMKPMSGYVIDWGEELNNKTWLEKSIVYYPRYTGAEVEEEVDGIVVKLLIVEYEDLLGFKKIKGE